MIPTVTLDPRGPWAAVRRQELVRYASELGIKDISEAMPKELIVRRLEALSVPPPRVRPRPIGKDLDPRAGDTDLNSHHYTGAAPEPVAKTNTVTIDADDLLEREWNAQQKKTKSVDQMTWNEMRAEARSRGIKLNRRWRFDDLKAILNGKDAP